LKHYLYYPFKKGFQFNDGGVDPGPLAQHRNAYAIKRYVTKYSRTSLNRHEQATAEGEFVIFKPDSMPLNREQGPLHKVEDTALLLILAHGTSSDASRHQLEPEYRASGEKITAEQLAKDLYDFGLHETHKLIKMLSCHGAGNCLAATGAQTGNQFFAGLLAKYLRENHHFNDVVVGGYAGAVNSAASARTTREAQKPRTYERSVTVYVSDGQGQRIAHDYVKWFNGAGEQVSRDRIAQLKGHH
jgi:hypothetical protein